MLNYSLNLEINHKKEDQMQPNVSQIRENFDSTLKAATTTLLALNKSPEALAPANFQKLLPQLKLHLTQITDTLKKNPDIKLNPTIATNLQKAIQNIQNNSRLLQEQAGSSQIQLKNVLSDCSDLIKKKLERGQRVGEVEGGGIG